MYNLYLDEKNKRIEAKKISKELKELLDIQKHKKTRDFLYKKYQKRIKQFIIDVSNKIIL